MQKHPQNIKSYKTTHPAKQCSAQASTVAHGDAGAREGRPANATISRLKPPRSPMEMPEREKADIFQHVTWV
jgi:hypothetical protein